MPKVNLNTLKSRFQNGDKPDGADFVDLIDTLIDILDSSIENDDVPNGELTPDKLNPGSALQVIRTSVDGLSAGWSNDNSVSQLVTQNSHGFSNGEVLTLNGAGQYVLAQADALSTAQPVGMVTEVVSANSFVLTTAGLVTTPATITPGVLHYLSPTTPGAVTTSIPAGSGQYISSVLFGRTASTGFLVLGSRATPVVTGTGTFDPVYITAEVLSTASPTSFTQLDIDSLVPALSGIPFRFGIFQVDGTGNGTNDIGQIEFRVNSGQPTFRVHRVRPAESNNGDGNVVTFFFPVDTSPKAIEFRRTGNSYDSEIRLIGYIT